LRSGAAGARRLLHSAAALAERRTGLPGRFALPATLAGLSLLLALVGMYWDIGAHIDDGRDASVLAAPHIPIIVGLHALVLAGVLNGLLPGPRAPGERSLADGRLRLAPGAIQMIVCGSVAILAFPLDLAWHALFGEDVTLWGPTHLFMIGGGTLGVIGVWMLLRNGMALGSPTRLVRASQVALAGGLVLGASSFGAEFDFGVPQFQLLYQPLLIAFTAGLGFVCARCTLGPLGALKALAFYLLMRALLAVFVGPVLGFTTPDLALYVAEALVVEAAALRSPRSPLRLALWSGAGIGTIGLATEWGWTQLTMAHPWTPAMLPEAPLLALAAGTGGALLGARMAQALVEADAPRAAFPPIPAPAVVVAAVAVLAALAMPLPRTGGDGTVATIVPTPAGEGQVDLTVRLEPSEAAAGSEWFEVISWQGREPRRLTDLVQVGPGRFETTEPVPAAGPDWKTLVRLGTGSHLMAAPVYLPPSPLSGRPGVPVGPRRERMESDTFQLQREATGGPRWLTTLAYALLLAMAAGWLWVTGWGLHVGEVRSRRPERVSPGAGVAAA